MNTENARFNMIEQQIRPAEVLDPRVLDAISCIQRENFVPQAYRELAFADTNIPLGSCKARGQLMMKPIMEARIIQALDIQDSDKILEIGTGSGYCTALLATLGHHVHSVELDAELLSIARANLSAHDITNVSLSQGDAARGWEADAPFDAIMITGSLPILPESFQQKLRPGGRMVVIVGTSPIMEVRLITRGENHEFTSTTLFETDFPALENADQGETFIF